MSNTTWQKSIVREVIKNGKKYISTMYWFAGPDNSALAGKGNIKVLGELLLDMKKKSPPASYRLHAATKYTYTIVKTKDCKYRIDNQMPLILKEPKNMSKLDAGPRLNIQYQIGGNSHAKVLVRTKPIECPPDITVGLIDEDQDFGFDPGSVMEFIEEALKYSAENRCTTYIVWTIMEVKHLSAGSGSFSRDWSSDDWENLETAVAAPVVPVKSDVGVILKQVPRVVVKKIPVIGFVFGLMFGIGRLIDGDIDGALDEVASGAASCIL